MGIGVDKVDDVFFGFLVVGRFISRVFLDNPCSRSLFHRFCFKINSLISLCFLILVLSLDFFFKAEMEYLQQSIPT